jgi:hypothetical protein
MASSDPRLKLLNRPHVKPLMDLVQAIRSRPTSVPNVDPLDGGTKATALFLLESPGPKAVGSQFISRNNPDPSAKNMCETLSKAGLKREETVLWNVVPYCISTVARNGKPSRAPDQRFRPRYVGLHQRYVKSSSYRFLRQRCEVSAVQDIEASARRVYCP